MAILTDENSGGPEEPQLLIPEVEFVTRQRRRRLWLRSLVLLGVGSLVAVAIHFGVGGYSARVSPRGVAAPLAGSAAGTHAARLAAQVCTSRFTQPYSSSNPYTRNYVYAAYPTTVRRLARINYLNAGTPGYNAYPNDLRLVVCVIRNPVTGKRWTTGCPPRWEGVHGVKAEKIHMAALEVCERAAFQLAGPDQSLWIVPVPARYAGYAYRHRADYLPAVLSNFGLFNYKAPPTGW
jgi:hypothetical protein